MRLADYKAALDAAHTEIGELLQQRAKLDDRLNQLKTTVDALSTLLKTSPQIDGGFSNAYGVLAGIEGLMAPGAGAGDMGISDAIRQLLIESKAPLTPPEIRNYLSDKGFDFNAYANPLAVIHNTLKRLNKQGEIAGIAGAAGQVTSYVINQFHPAMSLRMRQPASDEETGRLHRLLSRRQDVPPQPGDDDLPVSDPEHPIHHAESIAKVSTPGELKGQLEERLGRKPK
jgi:hypothetical protein